MAVNIGPRIGIEGEAEYRKQINNIVQQTKTLSSQMKALTSSFDKNSKSISDNNKQHKLLQDQIKAQQEKLRVLNDMLQKSKEKFGENSDKTLKWKQAVADAQADLNNLQNELRSLPSNLDIVAQKIGEMGSKLESLGSKITSIGSQLTQKLTVPITTAFGAAIKVTADFEAEMSKVQAISGANADQLAILTEKAREMGAKTKFTAAEAGQAFKYMAMAGWKTEDMLGGIEGIMNLAAASGEELGTTSDIVTDALTAFGMGADQAGRFADILASAASNANTNVAMMGESFKYVAPVAGSLGYSAEDVAIALGLMANSGIKADMAGTSLRNLLNRMAKPTKESAEAMERLGLELYDGEGKMYSFREIMEQLRTSMKDINVPIDEYERQLDILDAQLEDGTLTEKKYEAALEELNKQTFGAEGAEKARAAAMLGGTRAMSGLLAIANATEKDFNDLADAIDNSSQQFAMLADGSVKPLNEALKDGSEIIGTYNGQAEAMAAVMLNNLSGQWTIIKSKLTEFALSIGNLLLPKLKELTKYISDLVDKFNNMSDEEKMQIVKIAGIVAAIGPLLMGLGKFIGIIGQILQFAPQLATALQGAGGAISGLGAGAAGAVAPVLAIIAAIAVLVAAFVNLWKNNEEFRTGMTETWNGIKASFSNFVAQIEERLPAIQEAFDNVVKVVKPIWEGFCQLLGPTFQAAFDTIAVVLDALLNAIINVIDMITGILTGNKELFMQGLTGFLTTIWTYLLQWWTILWTWLTETINVVLSFFGTSLEELWDKIKTFFEDLWDGITEKVTELVDWVIEKVNEVCDFIASLPSKFYQWGVDMIQSLIDGIRSMIGALVDCVTEVADTIASYIHFSEPDVGPLSKFHKWMPDMMKQMAKQIEDGRLQVRVAAAHVAGDIATPMGGARNVTLNNNFAFNGGYTEAEGMTIVRQINRQLGALYI